MLLNSVAQFLAVLEASQLLREVALRQVREQVAQGPPDLTLNRLARSMVRAGVLTNYQVDRLSEGHSNGFYVGKYKLLDVLGRGGMGTVYLAEQTTMLRLVALKVVTNIAGCHPGTLIRFKREARAVASLSHPNIVQAYDFDEIDGIPFISMEYAEGIDAADQVARFGKLSWSQAADHIMQAALGLEHARQAGLVHRDIKPGNLLISTKGEVKLLDLGLCMHSDNRKETLVTRDIQVGTVDLMAPEQAIDSHRVDTRADIYSLGCVFYALLAARLPFLGKNTAQKLMLHQTADPRPIQRHCPDVPPELAAIIAKMMEKKPEDRFQTPAEVAEALAPFAVRQIPPYNPDTIKLRRTTLASVLGRAPEPSSINVNAQMFGLRCELRNSTKTSLVNTA